MTICLIILLIIMISIFYILFFSIVGFILYRQIINDFRKMYGVKGREETDKIINKRAKKKC